MSANTKTSLTGPNRRDSPKRKPMFLEFESATTMGEKITISLLQISSVNPNTDSQGGTVIQMANGAYHYVKPSYKEVTGEIRLMCR